MPSLFWRKNNTDTVSGTATYTIKPDDTVDVVLNGKEKIKVVKNDDGCWQAEGEGEAEGDVQTRDANLADGAAEAEAAVAAAEAAVAAAEKAVAAAKADAGEADAAAAAEKAVAAAKVRITVAQNAVTNLQEGDKRTDLQVRLNKLIPGAGGARRKRRSNKRKPKKSAKKLKRSKKGKTHKQKK